MVMKMLNFAIGCHLSCVNGYLDMAKTAIEINANTFQFFTRNPRGGKAKELDLEDIKKFNEFAKNHNFAYIIAHAPYTMNLASTDDKRSFAIEMMKDDLDKLKYVDKVYYNFHPGSHVNQGEEIGINKIISAINSCVVSEEGPILLLETMAGKGSEIGKDFYQIRKIIDGVKYKNRIGVTIDTCHIFDAGYDIRDHLNEVLEEFDKIIGLDRLKAIHLNDSMNELGSRKDRHAKLGKGCISLEALLNFVNDERLKNLPFILETPNELEGYKQEIELVRSNLR